MSLGAMRDLPLVVWQSAQRVRGRRPALPWFPYPVIRRLSTLIRPDWAVLEYGSGNSTIWLAHRVRALRSVENDPAWYESVRTQLPAGVLYELVQPPRYGMISDDEICSYDLVIVDGLGRAECMKNALRAVRSGGFIYLDNIDTEGRAAFVLLQAATRAIELFTGFPPAQPTVTTGALAQLPRA